MLSLLLTSTLPAAPASRGAAKPAKPAPSATSKASPSQQPASTKNAPLVDTAAVRRYYLDGDFDPAIDLLETSLRYKTGFSRADSVFIFKHLGVMYAAKYETREKGKHYMHRLLEVEPTARILDMYASDMIYMIFKNIQDEFDASRDRYVRADTTLGRGRGTGPTAGPEKKDPPRKESSSGYLWLSAAAAVAVAGGAATYYYFSDVPKTVTQDHQPK